MLQFSPENILLIGSILIFTAILISRAGFKFGIPVLLLFIVVGMAFGVDGLGLAFDNFHIAQFIGTIRKNVSVHTCIGVPSIGVGITSPREPAPYA